MYTEKKLYNREVGLRYDYSKNVKHFSRAKSPTTIRQNKSIGKGKCLQLRDIPGEGNITTFKGKNFTVNGYKKGNNGHFDATYSPGRKELKIDLPIFFNSGFPRPKADYFIKNIKDTWDEKYKIQTNVTDGEWITELNDVKVNVDVQEVKDTQAYFTMNYDPKTYKGDDGVLMGNVTLSEEGYNQTENTNYNVYGHEAGHMFGLGDEYQVGDENYKITTDKISVFDGNVQQSFDKVHNKRFSYKSVDYIIWKYDQSWDLTIDGKKYELNPTPNDGDFILLNKNTGKRSGALPGIATHYDLTKEAFGETYADEHAVRDDAKTLDSIMNETGTVHKHHYVTFWDAMVKAIQADPTYGSTESDKAPNMKSDWSIA